MTALPKLLDHVPKASLDIPLCSSQRDTSPLVSTGFPPTPPEPSLETQQIPQREVAYYVHFLRKPVVIEHKEEQPKSLILIEK